MIGLKNHREFPLPYGTIHLDFWGKPEDGIPAISPPAIGQDLYISQSLEHIRRFYDNPRLHFLKQVHGEEVIFLDGNILPLSPVFWAEADSVFSGSAEHAAIIRIADCIPILFFHEEQPIFGGIHAGWKGVQERVFTQTLRRITHHFPQAGKEKFQFYIGPHNRAQTYEVRKDVYDFFADEFVLPHPEPDKKYLDLTSALVWEMRENGIPDERIHDLNINNFLHPDYYSHRRGENGRNIAWIGLRRHLL